MAGMVFYSPLLTSSLKIKARIHSCAKITTKVKPVRNGHSKIDKTILLMTNGSLMKIESIAEHSAILFDLR